MCLALREALVIETTVNNVEMVSTLFTEVEHLEPGRSSRGTKNT